MIPITSRKHAKSHFNQQVGAALAAMLLPLAAHAGDDEQQKGPQTLQEVKIVGSAGNGFRAERAESPKYTEALVDTAQTIQVIKRELIEQQGAVTLTEALRSTPGVGAFFLGENGNTNTGDAVYMRGFDTSGSIYVDGVRDVSSISRDVFNIEQIDVLKGPAGTDNGRSAPTGSVNLISKQPTLRDSASASLTAGSGQQKRATADINRVIDKASGTAFRINLMDQDSGNPARDRVKARRWAIAPTLGWGLNGSTRVYLDYLHVKQDNVPDGGVPTIGLPGYTSPDPLRPYISNAPKVDPANFYGSTLDHDNVKADMVTARIEHDFSPTLRLQNTARYGKTSQNYLLTAFTATGANLKTPSPTDFAGWTLARTNLNVKDQENEIITNQTNLTSDFGTGGLTHTVVAGLELSAEKQRNFGYGAAGTLPVTSLYHPDYKLPVAVTLARNGVYGDGSTTTQSVYGFDTIKLGQRWIFNGGVRLDRYNTTFSGAALSTASANPTLPVGTLVHTNLSLSDTLVNGKLSALYKPTPDSSVYALVASSKLPPGGATFALSTSASSATNPKFDPQETVTTEVGAKWDLLKQKLSLSAAAYRTVVKNEVEQDPVDAQYYQTGKKRVQGIEVGVTGEVMRNWLVSAGYTRMDTRVESGKLVTANGTNALTYTPKQAFTAWTSYTLPVGLKVGAGARYVDRLLRGTDGAVGTPAYADAYWVFDAMASYSVTKNVDLQLNLYNLADTEYIAAINKSGYRYTPGAPRSASLTANFRF
jgi:catecholate siderophore receptor